MKRFAIWFLTAMFMFAGPVWADFPYLVSEPPLQSMVAWDIEANGLLRVGYDLTGNGSPDYYTLRRVRAAFFSSATLRETVQANADSLLFYVPYPDTTFYYAAMKSPLFYAADPDEDGHWDLIYKDVSEDGVNGNEVFYDNPSGKFAPPAPS
ncbi:MAG: hypothetical protein ACE5ER_12665, partial [Nitrospinaceae bacterium]